uniref:Cytochrome P450 n=1 Tax=Arcella intermedia TaxID=1963864 RepID=A0A6B2L4U7_9EUKA
MKKGLPQTILDLKKRFGPVYSLYLWGPLVTFTELQDVKFILKNIDDFPKTLPPPQFFHLVKDFSGFENITQVNNPIWHDHRAILNKSFTNNKIFFDPIQQKSRQCISMWKTGEPVFIGTFLQKMTLDALGTCIFGKDFNTLGGNLSGPLSAYNNIINFMSKPYFLFFPQLVNLPIPPFTKLKQSLQEFNSACWKIIEDSKREETKGKAHLISLMLSNGLPDQVVKDNVAVFFLAGHETTASTLNWACAMIATHQDVQNKLRDELASVTSNFSRDLTYEDLKDLNYMEGFIKEVMRLYPAASIIGNRKSAKDGVVGEWFVPKGTVVQVDVISNLQDPAIWTNPQIFDPDRWNPERLTKQQRSCWIPFSYGPRICIGMNFSLLEQKIFLSTMLKEFNEIKMAPGSVIQIKQAMNTPDPTKLALQFRV